MAIEIKNLRDNSAGLEDIADLLEIPREEFRAYNYDHCQSLEELQFEIYPDFLKDGYHRQTAEDIAREMALDLCAIQRSR